MKTHGKARPFVLLAFLFLAILLGHWIFSQYQPSKSAPVAPVVSKSEAESPPPVAASEEPTESNSAATAGGSAGATEPVAIDAPANSGNRPPLPPWMKAISALPDADRPTCRDDGDDPPAYKVKRVLLREEKPLDGFSRFRRTSLIETDMKYPILRVEEEIRIEGHAREEFIVSRVTSVASHVIVEPQPGRTEAMEDWARKRNIKPQRRGPASPIYLLPVSMTALDDLPNAIAELKKEAATFAVAEPDYIVQPSLTPNDSSFSGLWGMNNTGQSGGKSDADIDAVEAWQTAHPASGASVVVGVIDTGIDYNHPDLAANIWINTDEIAGNGIDDDGNGYVDDRHGWDFANNDNDPMDDHFHGTHVAGTIGAIGNNAAGVAGVVWTPKLMPLKFLGTNGGTLSDAIEAIDYATANGCRLTNNSWGGGGWSQSLSNAIQRAENSGVLFVAAAGNSALDIDENPSYPAAYPQPIILSVASSTHTDTLSNFSNFGVKNVDVAAPGSGILSTFPTTMTGVMSEYGMPANYATISGTSMAAPHVAGLAALLWSHQPGLSAATVKSRIMTRGDLIPTLSTSVMSSRRINAANTVLMSGGDPPPELLFASVKTIFAAGNDDESLNPGETIEIRPEMMNFGGTTAQPVTIEVLPQSAGLTLVGNAMISVPAIAPMSRQSPGSPLRVAVSSNLADDTRVEIQLIARWQDGRQLTHLYKAVVVQSQPITEFEINWRPGEPVADTVRERVYLMDRTSERVLAIDTTTGNVTAAAELAGSSDIPPPVENLSLRTGMLAVSHGGGKLWAALTHDKIIQAFNLPDLTPAGTFQMGFSPVSLAQSANGRLFATSTDYSGSVREINPSTGEVIRTFDKHNSQGTYYMHSLLRMNAEGTRLFVGETGLRTSGGPALIDEFDVGGTGLPSLVKSHPYWQFFMKDFEVDSPRQRIYTVNGLFRGIQVTETHPGGDYGFLWPFVWADAASVKAPPGSNSVYGATGDFYEGEISRFDGADGMRTERRVVGTEGKFLPPRSLAVTPGGSRVYVKSFFTGTPHEGVSGYRYYLGMIGASVLNQSSFPPANPTPPKLVVSHVQFSESAANFDGIVSPGESVRIRPTFRNSGNSTATGITLTCATSTQGVSILAPASQSIPDISGAAFGSPAEFFVLEIGGGVADGTVVSVILSLNYSGGLTSDHIHSFTVRTVVPKTVTTPTQQETHGALGGVLADKTRDIVYLQDRQNRRILAIDTGLGVASASCPLVGPVKVGMATAPPALGDMALSTDGTKLYVAIRDARIIQVISLPDFKTVASWNYDFNPTSLATDALGRIYSASDVGQPRQIDGNTGAVLGQFGSSNHRLLRSSPDGTLLFAPWSGEATRFDTTGPGLPATLGTSAIGTSGRTRITLDFLYDQTRQLCLNAPSGLNLKLSTFDGVITDWPTPNSVCSIAMDPTGDRIWTGSSHTTTGAIRVFDANTGTVLREFDITGDNFTLMNASLAVTPNGRAVYVMRKPIGTSQPSVDGFYYRVGIIGAEKADLDLPVIAGAFAIKSVAVADPLPAPNNHDGYAGPGETLFITPVLKNQALTTATGVELSLLSSSAKATVLTPAAVAVGTMTAYGTFTPVPPFQVAIHSAAEDGEELVLKFRVRRDGAADEDIDHKVVVFKPDTARTSTLNFQIGEIIADPSRNSVYLVDMTHSRLLRFDTDTNIMSAAAPLVGSPGAGHLDFSPDHSRLFIALTGERKLQAFNLPQLTQADVIDVDFDIHSIACGPDDSIYASSTENWGNIRQLHPLTGEVLSVFNKGSSIYQNSLLRTNPNRSRLFMVETSLSGSGICPEWDILQSPVARAASHAYNLANNLDMRVDDIHQRIYFSVAGVSGIGVTEMETGLAGLVWQHGSLATGVRGLAFHPNSLFVQALGTGSIVRFDRATGTRVGHYDVATSTGDLGDRGIAVTPNGRVVFVRKPATGNHTLGVIGGPAITTTLPTVAASTYAGGNRSLRQDHAVALGTSVLNAGSAGTLAHNWRVLDGPADANFSATTAQNTTASFNAPGRYLVEVTSKSGAIESRDIVVVDVAPAPPTVSVTASKESASLYKKTPGEFTFTRQGGDLTEPLIVKFATGGNAIAGTHYQTLGTTITIPAGQWSVTSPVAISAASLASPLNVVVTLSTDSAYAIGDSRAATVALIDGSFASWRQILLEGELPAQREPLADPDGDGRANLLEYALGTDPTSPDHGQAVQTKMDPVHGLCLTYTIPFGSAAGYTVETSTSLDALSWQSGPAHLQEISRVTNPDGSVTVKAARIEPNGTNKTAFIRLRVGL